jgi:DNA-directed RNA polymerase subunit RPC12/RpoP
MSLANQEKEQAEFLQAATEMYEEIRWWRAKHPEASFDEIAVQVTPRRRELMGRLMAQLASQYGDGEALEGMSCPDCGEAMMYKGKSGRGVEHLEGATELARAYYYCAQCETGLFPPG